MDLRKYGFSLLTALTAGSSFLGVSPPSQILQVGVVIVTMILVVVLYWVDVYYQNMLYGSVLRGRFLELFRLDKKSGLSNYISALAGSKNLSNTLWLLYGGFVMGLLVLGFIAMFNAHCDFIISSNRAVNSTVSVGSSAAATSATGSTSSNTADISQCLGESVKRVPIITALLISTFAITFGAILAIFLVYEKERDYRVGALSQKFRAEYEGFVSIADKEEQKKKADKIEQYIQGVFLKARESGKKSVSLEKAWGLEEVKRSSEHIGSPFH